MNTLESTMQSIRPLIRPRSASYSVVTCRTEVRRISISPNESGSAPPTRTSWSPARRSRKRRKQSGTACWFNWRIQRISFAVCNSQTTIDSVTHQLLYTVHRPLNRCYSSSSSSSTDAASAWGPPASSNAFDHTATGLSLHERIPRPLQKVERQLSQLQNRMYFLPPARNSSALFTQYSTHSGSTTS